MILFPIPAEIVKDSQFPFTVDMTKARVRIDVENNHLIIEGIEIRRIDI